MKPGIREILHQTSKNPLGYLVVTAIYSGWWSQVDTPISIYNAKTGLSTTVDYDPEGKVTSTIHTNADGSGTFANDDLGLYGGFSGPIKPSEPKPTVHTNADGSGTFADDDLGLYGGFSGPIPDPTSKGVIGAFKHKPSLEVGSATTAGSGLDKKPSQEVTNTNPTQQQPSKQIYEPIHKLRVREPATPTAGPPSDKPPTLPGAKEQVKADVLRQIGDSASADANKKPGVWMHLPRGTPPTGKLNVIPGNQSPSQVLQGGGINKVGSQTDVAGPKEKLKVIPNSQSPSKVLQGGGVSKVMSQPTEAVPKEKAKIPPSNQPSGSGFQGGGVSKVQSQNPSGSRSGSDLGRKEISHKKLFEPIHKLRVKPQSLQPVKPKSAGSSERFRAPR